MPVKAIVSIIGILIFIILLYVAYISLKEKEKRAAIISFFSGLVLPLPFFLVGFLSFPYHFVLTYGLLTVTFIIIVALFFPIGRKPDIIIDTPCRFDERDTMFSRNKLVPGTGEYEKYYIANPHYKALDEKFREKPGLASPGAIYYDPFSFSSAHASFRAVECYGEIVHGGPASRKIKASPEKISMYIKKWAKKIGAVDVGITELQDYHLYTHKGRGKKYGAAIEKKHKYAIVFTVEMNKDMLDMAPYGPTIMESAQQYLQSGAIAVQVAEFIRALGYEATAHIDANYEIICPLVAQDAGLGEIGRMGLLMTPRLGPRVRISAVTTNLPLKTDKRAHDTSMIDFCRKCKKCADICPVSAIPFDDRKNNDGALRWKINSESCFTYWCTIGTDCGRCMDVCPYSHPDNLLHNAIRWGIKTSSAFRFLALKLDDLFYGRRPKIKKAPSWMYIQYKLN